MPTATPSPTVIATPVCGFTPLASTPAWGVASGDYVIQNQTQWTNVNGTGTAVPAVNFSTQMILELSQTVVFDCMCSANPPVIVSVCTYPDHIQVLYHNGGETCPTPGGVTCNSVFTTFLQSVVAVPQSNLPVSWVSE